MTNPSTKLAESLEVLKGLQNRGVIAICSRDMTRTHRERLVSPFPREEIGWRGINQSLSPRKFLTKFSRYRRISLNQADIWVLGP